MVNHITLKSVSNKMNIIDSGKVTHVYGPPKSGKSTLSANIAFELVKFGKQVLIISTERPIEIRMNSMIKAESTFDLSFLTNIITSDIFSFEDLLQIVTQELENYIEKIDLIIIDSLTANYRFDAGPISLTLLRKILSSIQAIAISYKKAIMFTNQVTAVMNESNEFRPVASASTRCYSDITIKLVKTIDGKTEMIFEDHEGTEIDSLEPFSIIPAGIEDFNLLFQFEEK